MELNTRMEEEDGHEEIEKRLWGNLWFMGFKHWKDLGKFSHLSSYQILGVLMGLGLANRILLVLYKGRKEGAEEGKKKKTKQTANGCIYSFQKKCLIRNLKTEIYWFLNVEHLRKKFTLRKKDHKSAGNFSPIQNISCTWLLEFPSQSWSCAGICAEFQSKGAATLTWSC